MLLTAQHCRPPAASCLGRQPGTASRPSCMRTGQRMCRHVQASSPRVGASPLSSLDEMKREGDQMRNAAELDTTAHELHQHISSMLDDQSPTEPKHASTKAEMPPSMPYVPTGAPETAWYCWPDGYIGQSFGLAGKLEPRASPLQADVDLLSEFVTRRRESCRYSEHTIDSSRAASQMVQAVVGGAVDLGMFNASGSASLEMSSKFSSQAVSHNLVASFQENELLEMLSPSLSQAAKNMLLHEGPQAFAAKYGTHFVSGVGFRGAFIGSITVRLVDVKVAAGAAVSFKASYGKVSGMAELKTAMEDSLQTSDVTFTWHKYGVADDSSLDLLEDYCATNDARFANMRALAMHTADQARGYPRLVKLRPYSTLPDYVDACSRHCADNKMEPSIELQELEQALSYLTQQYRKASYIMQVIENDKRLNVLNAPTEVAQQRGSLAYKVRNLLLLMTQIFKTKDAQGVESWPDSPGPYYAPPSLYLLRTFFKYDARPLEVEPRHAGPFALGTKLKQQLDEVDRLDYELWKAVQRPFMMAPQNPRQYTPKLDPGARFSVISVASNASKDQPFGSWWLDHAQQETFTKPGLYIVRLADNWDRESQEPNRLELVGRTQHFAVASDAAGAAKVMIRVKEYFEECLERDPGTVGKFPDGNVFVMFAVGWDFPAADASFAAAHSKILALTGFDLGQKPLPEPDVIKEALLLSAQIMSPLSILFDPAAFTERIATIQAGAVAKAGPATAVSKLNTSLGSFAAVSLTALVYNPGEINPDKSWQRKRVGSQLNSPPASSVPLSMVMVEQIVPL